MKTAEEWRGSKLPWQYKHAVDNTSQYLYTDTEIKQIQLDAMKEGMRRAAMECDKNIMDETFNEGDWHMSESAKQIKETILTTAEQ